MKVKALLLALLSGVVLTATAQEYQPQVGFSTEKGYKTNFKKNKAKDDKGNGCQRTFKIFSGNPPEAAFFLSGRGGGAASHCVILLQGECGGQ